MVSGRERLLLLVPPGTRPAGLSLLLLLLLRRDAVAQKGRWRPGGGAGKAFPPLCLDARPERTQGEHRPLPSPRMSLIRGERGEREGKRWGSLIQRCSSHKTQFCTSAASFFHPVLKFCELSTPFPVSQFGIVKKCRMAVFTRTQVELQFLSSCNLLLIGGAICSKTQSGFCSPGYRFSLCPESPGSFRNFSPKKKVSSQAALVASSLIKLNGRLEEVLAFSFLKRSCKKN